MTDPIDELRRHGGQNGPQPRASFADDLERELRSRHAMGRPAADPPVGRDWRRPAIGWAIAGAVVVAGFFALRGAVDGQRVDTATSVTVSTSSALTSTPPDDTDRDGTDQDDAAPDDELEPSPTGPTTTADGGTGPDDDESNDVDGSTSRPDAEGATTASPTSTPTTSTAEPTSTVPTASTTRPTSTPTSSTDSTVETILTLSVDSRGGRDRLTWTIDGPTTDIAGFEIEWVQGESGGSATLVRDANARSVTVDRPTDGSVGYLVVARDENGASVAQSDVVRSG